MENGLITGKLNMQDQKERFRRTQLAIDVFDSLKAEYIETTEDWLIRNGKILADECKLVAQKLSEKKQSDMINIKITITCGNRSYSEILDESEMNDIREHFDECKTNGANPHMKDLTFEENIKPIPETSMERLKDFSGNHFIFGWMECILQSDRAPHCLWAYNDEDTTFKVEHIDGH